jgi:hypothetical protein
MIAAIWVVVAVLAACWTGLAALLAQLTDWLSAAMASGAAGSALDQIGQWPVPAWLAPWVDPAWVETMQASVLEWLQWLSAAMPAIGGLMGWISPLVWLLWGLGLVVLLCVGGGLHFLARRFDRVVPA